MERKIVLVIVDFGGCLLYMFYKSVVEKYNLVSFILRFFVIIVFYVVLIEKYLVVVIKDKDYF